MVQFLDGSFLDIVLFGVLPAVIISAIVIYKMNKNNKKKEAEE